MILNASYNFKNLCPKNEPPLDWMYSHSGCRQVSGMEKLSDGMMVTISRSLMPRPPICECSDEDDDVDEDGDDDDDFDDDEDGSEG